MTVDTTTGEILETPTTPAATLEQIKQAASAFRELASTVELWAQVHGGNKHLTIEGFQTAGLLVGVTAVVTHTERLDDGTWKASAEARRDGLVVGAADALCSKAEKRWARADDYAILSMASTRAMSRALRAVVAPIIKLADPTIETTAAEEMPDLPAKRVDKPETPPTISEGQVGLIRARARSQKIDDQALIGLVYEIAGKTPPPARGPDAANQHLESVLPRFRRSNIDALLEKIGGDQ